MAAYVIGNLKKKRLFLERLPKVRKIPIYGVFQTKNLVFPIKNLAFRSETLDFDRKTRYFKLKI